MTAETILQIIGVAFAAASGGFAAYAAIKADLAAVKAVQDIHNQSIARAHERIDELGSRPRF